MSKNTLLPKCRHCGEVQTYCQLIDINGHQHVWSKCERCDKVFRAIPRQERPCDLVPNALPLHLTQVQRETGVIPTPRGNYRAAKPEKKRRQPNTEPLTDRQRRVLVDAGYSSDDLSTWTKADGMHALSALIPKHGRADYTEYMNSPEWKAKSKAALQRQVDGCAVCCSTRRLQVHHRTYERLGHEKDTDLVVLCGRCHMKFHGIIRHTRTESKPQEEPRGSELDRDFARLCARDD